MDASFSDEEDGGTQRSRQLSLPDFLVDSAIAGAQIGGEDDGQDVASLRNQGEPSRSRLPELPPLSDSVDGSRSRNGSDAAASDGVAVTMVRLMLSSDAQRPVIN